MLKTSAQVPEKSKQELMAALSTMLAKTTGKPEEYVMVLVEQVDGMFAGKPGPVAFADVRGIGGLSKPVNGRITKELCDILHARLAIPPESVYCVFTEVAAASWGWNRATFG